MAGSNGSGNDNFFSLRVFLLSDFTKLNNVQIVRSNNAPELEKLEEENLKTEGQGTAEEVLGN